MKRKKQKRQATVEKIFYYSELNFSRLFKRFFMRTNAFHKYVCNVYYAHTEAQRHGSGLHKIL